MASTQMLHLGRYTDQVQAGLDRLHTQRYMERLWKKDASLWSDDPKTRTAITQRLGWLTITSVMEQQTATLQQFAQEVRRAGFTHALLLGMGGSSLFSEVCRNTFGVAKGALDLAVLDTTDPTAIRSHQQRCSLQHTLAIISSKSGSTTEVTSLAKYFYEAFRQAGLPPGEHCLVITDQGTPLYAQANAWKARRIFAHGPNTGADVGGRFSALTYFGLVPATLLGIDVSQLLGAAQEMLARCQPTVPIQQNPAAQLGVVLGELATQGRTKVTLLRPPILKSLGTWMEQLIAESTGKSGKGIVPLMDGPLPTIDAYHTDRLFLEVQVGSHVDESLNQHVLAIIKAGHPVVRIRWDNSYDLGGEVVRWCIATTIAGSLLHVNPFDEPNVQESKDRTNALLLQYARDSRFSEESPLVVENDIKVFGALKGAMTSLRQCLSEWFSQARPNDYVAVLSFLPRTSELDRMAHEIGLKLAERLSCARMIQFGPRYLHSTGQLFKGGPDEGVFLMLTADDPIDLKIPGEPFTFSVLKQAQALGDFQAMQQRGRRILRMHLCGNAEQSAHQLLNAIDAALTSTTRR